MKNITALLHNFKKMELPLKSLVLTIPVSTVSQRRNVLKASFNENKYEYGTTAKVVKRLVWGFLRSVEL